MIETIGILTFIFGTIIGSFLNVVVYRFGTGVTLGGRSMCLSCGYKLLWFDLVPVASFAAIGGRCRNCKVKLSYQYPIVEFLTGFVFTSFMVKALVVFGISFTGIIFFIIAALLWSLLIVILVYDFKHMIIPNRLVWIFNGLAFLFAFISYNGGVVHFGLPTVWNLLAAPIIATPFLLIWFFSKGRAFGFGDVKLSLGLSWMLGLNQATGMFFLSFWLGGIVAVILMLWKPKQYRKNTKLPFAPFLITATFFVSLFALSYQFFLGL